MKYLIFGLGNPGLEYSETRHNIGFETLDFITKKQGVDWASVKLGLRSEFSFKGRKIILIKPNTFMNLSGKSVQYWIQSEKIKPENILVITDDLAIEFGLLRLRNKGSAGGHNGLKSIIETLGSADFPRLRMGIGNNFQNGKQVDFVLGKWTNDEQVTVENMIKKCEKAVLNFCFHGIGRATQELNKDIIE